jgi:hypothetical protein
MIHRNHRKKNHSSEYKHFVCFFLIEYYLNSLFRYKLRRFIESIGFRLSIAVLFISDLILILVSIILDQTKPSGSPASASIYTLDVISLVLSIIFMLDILLRIFAQG